ncbi:zinc ribbon domain-containing protein [uncultured Sphingomonas sp.]|uniref:zinc ribbon domain-containing protein n=1 Tax=uncultured Sphingomonas sp. TaxID=158754 RepID=UPI0026134BDA|nr:zinc ribbon domain-containing protein [uncultured Sphingomonas sp.]
MEPLIGLIVIILWASLNALIAAKRHRSGWIMFALSTVPVVPVVLLVSLGSGGNGVIMGWFAFASPLVAFITALSLENGREAAARKGAHGDYVRCPSCAEPVRKLAIKCRHCASELPAAGPRDETRTSPASETFDLL